jgi:hypothetical protein
VYIDSISVAAEAMDRSTHGEVGVHAFLTQMIGLLRQSKEAVEAGGTVIMPKTYLGKEAGHIAFFLGTEGNRVGLQSP